MLNYASNLDTKLYQELREQSPNCRCRQYNMNSFGIIIGFFLIALINCDYEESSKHNHQYNLRQPVCPETAEEIRLKNPTIPIELDIGKKLLLLYDRIAANLQLDMKIKKISANYFTKLQGHLMDNFVERADSEEVKNYKHVFKTMVDIINGLEFGARLEYEKQKDQVTLSLLKDYDEGEAEYKHEDRHEDSLKVHDLYTLVD